MSHCTAFHDGENDAHVILHLALANFTRPPFALGVLGIATASYLVLKCIGEIAMEMQYQKYKRMGLIEEEQQGPEDDGSGRRLKLKVVHWPDQPRRSRRKKSS